MSLYVEHLSQNYGDRQVLDDISFECSQGSIVGILGRNGVGKSTLLKIIAGIIMDYQGEVRIVGRVGYLSEKNPLYPNMYVREYLTWINLLIPHKSRNLQRVSELIDLVGLRAVAGQKISTLSKGYRQRVGLAAVLIPDPEILVLDEPINGLDPIQIIEYRNLIRSLRKNKVILFSSHLMQEIEALCDRVIVLKGGKVVDDMWLTELSQGYKHRLRLTVDQELDQGLFGAGFVIQRIGGESEYRYHIEGSPNEDIRYRVFDIVVAQGIRILDMRSEADGLATLFK